MMQSTDKHKPIPSLYAFDDAIRSQGYPHLAGVDEAGRGPLAGPVVAAAVMFPPDIAIEGVNDSKQLSEAKREDLYAQIIEKALAFGIGISDSVDIDTYNILQATLRASCEALSQLSVQPDYIITDYLKIQGQSCPVEPMTKGDQKSASIAAASILAKVTRDRLMVKFDEEYPGYAFASNKGYGAQAHLNALNEHGPTSIHRLTFNGVSFFDTECLRSHSYEKLMSRLLRCETMKETKRLKQEIESTFTWLPRVELVNLHEMIDQKISAQSV